jgi:MSHA biogenesis protein MshP
MSHNYNRAVATKAQACSLKKQSGSALVIAIFVIIVISLLGSAMMVLQRDSSEITSYEVFASRAYLSAYSASEIALVELFPLQIQNASAAIASCSNVTRNPSLPNNNAGFHGCSANVGCTQIAVSAGMATRYKVVSTAVCQNSQINTRRQITVEASDL